MFLVAFFVPLAVYLLLLGWINRQPRPVRMSGVWDLVALLFGLSGFLLVGGPAMLSSLNERWRMLWVFGEGSLGENLDGPRQWWMFLALVYFGLVVGTSAWLFHRRRHHTCLYNVEPATVEAAVEEACEHLGLSPTHTGNLFVFTFGRAGTEDSAGGDVVLELEPSGALKHVTLRWDPHDTPIRRAVEDEAYRRLVGMGAPYHETGLWLHLVGCALLVLSGLVVLGLIVRTVLVR